MTEIIVAVITGGLAVLGTVISNRSSETRIQRELLTHQAVVDTKLEELTREVREHNNFARRMPVVENDIKHVKEVISELKEYHK